MTKTQQNSSDSWLAPNWREYLDFARILDTIPHGVLLMDTERKTMGFNRFLEALLGYRRHDAVGVRGEYLLRSSLMKEGDPVGAALAADEPLFMEGDIINQGRKLVPVRFTLAPLWFHNGKRAGVVIYVEDISLLKDLGDKVHGVSLHGKIIGSSRKMQEIYEFLPIAARTDASALITGETGTGKDLVAELIHRESKRARSPFIKVNCGAIPESLLESEMFGHTRGAFTGADRDKPGMFRLAHGGTIFLTEIGDLPLALQVKLLTVLDDKEFFPVGADKKVKVDVRVIAATHRDLAAFVKQGKFREDLFYRLNVLRIHLPSLREREDDTRLLVDHFSREFAKGLGKNIKAVSPACLNILLSYGFPGNVRELKNIVEYAVNICPGDTIEPEHLPRSMFSSPPEPALPASGLEKGGGHREHSVVFPTSSSDEASGSFVPAIRSWAEKERELIMEALTRTKGQRSRAAELLGWSRSTLWRKIKHHGLE